MTADNPDRQALSEPHTTHTAVPTAQLRAHCTAQAHGTRLFYLTGMLHQLFDAAQGALQRTERLHRKPRLPTGGNTQHTESHS